MRSHLELEHTYAPGPDDEVPDLAATDGVTSVEKVDTVELVATYFDTEDLALTRAGVSLRRRLGGSDEGWRLKVPTGEGRVEIAQQLGRSTRTIPVALRRSVVAWTLGRPLAPVATIETHRATRRLLDADGALLAEVADDRVVGTPGDGAPPVVWREWEVELVDGERDLLAAVGSLLEAIDVPPSDHGRKIDRVLTLDPLPEAPEPDTAAGLLHQRVVDQVALLRLHDSGIRRRVPDSVHQFRVTCRRLRGALATFRPVLGRAVTEPIRDELRWVARTLSDARDAEVMHERLRGLLVEEPFVVGPVRRRLQRTYRAQEREGMRAGDELLTSDRYFSLLRALDELVSDPAWTERGSDDARKLTRRRLRKERRRVQGRVEAAQVLAEVGGEAHDVAMHRVRKGMKRWRYALEAAEPVIGEDAERLRAKAKELSQVLGERQDTTVTRTDLLAMARAATEEGESAFTYGRLHARESTRAGQLDGHFERNWRKLK
ncbi:MAG TPA: CYTH and CHAD domain-containing protein [Nocardioides sp.]|nr:CYTH and CHAD domain-containing protein [Nocardioides sp.]